MNTPHIQIAAEKIFDFFGLPVTNTLLTSWIVLLLLAAAAFLVFKKLKPVPAFLQNLWEIFVEGFLKMIEGVLGARKKAEKYLPLVATIFIFVLVSNWLGIFPGVGSVGFYEEVHGQKVFVPFFRSAASDLNFTLALAVLTVVLVNIYGARAIGLRHHLGKFFTFKNPIAFGVGLLEFISEFAKMISFSFRLFGNVFAGEVLLIIAAFLAPLFAPIPFLVLEIFVGFIQALVFAMLSMVFISIMVVEHH